MRMLTENTIDKKIKVLRTDDGMEFYSNELLNISKTMELWGIQQLEWLHNKMVLPRYWTYHY